MTEVVDQLPTKLRALVDEFRTLKALSLEVHCYIGDFEECLSTGSDDMRGMLSQEVPCEESSITFERSLLLVNKLCSIREEGLAIEYGSHWGSPTISKPAETTQSPIVRHLQTISTPGMVWHWKQHPRYS